MNDPNPYTAPKASLAKETLPVPLPSGALGKPEDFLLFRAGAVIWLVSCVAMVVASMLMIRLLIGGVLLAMLVGTYLLATIPAKTPGKDWFGGSLVLQLLSPIIALQALQDVPQPDWDRYTLFTRLGIWGECLALLCVLIGLSQLATWLQVPLLRKLTKVAAFLLVVDVLFLAWARAQHFGFEGIVIGLIWIFCGLVPLFLLLLVCWIGATMVPYYVGLPIPPSVTDPPRAE